MPKCVTSELLKRAKLYILTATKISLMMPMWPVDFLNKIYLFFFDDNICSVNYYCQDQGLFNCSSRPNSGGIKEI